MVFSKCISVKFLAAFCILICCRQILEAQTPTIFYEKSDNGGYDIFARNETLLPYTFKFNYVLENMETSIKEEALFVISSKTEKQFLVNVHPADPAKKRKFSYTYKYVKGDATRKFNEDTVIYKLPFEKGSSYKLFQGYNGKTSHQGKNELDFTMPVGTGVLAARAGIVVQIEQSFNQSCPDKECAKYNNYITILHADGSIANYLHIQQNSVVVKPGDKIAASTLIAKSGNVGWSTGPHLHFSVEQPSMDKEASIKTKFLVEGSPAPLLLKEGEKYGW